MVRHPFTLASFLVILSACGKEVGRVRFANEGAAETPVTLKAGDVAFWTDIDIEYEGNAALGYRVELVQDGKAVATVTCNPLGRMTTKIGWVETNLGSSHSRRGSGKMDCSAVVPSAGATNVKATLAFDAKPAALTLKKADLVLKQ